MFVTSRRIWDVVEQEGVIVRGGHSKAGSFAVRVGSRALRLIRRTNGFAPSGSGNFSVDPQQIDQRFIRLAFQVAKRIQCQSCAIDGMYRGGDDVAGEISYAYVSWMV